MNITSNFLNDSIKVSVFACTIIGAIFWTGQHYQKLTDTQANLVSDMASVKKDLDAVKKDIAVIKMGLFGKCDSAYCSTNTNK